LTFTGTENFDKFRAVSATKKSNAESYCITPIHCAAINPNTRYMKELIENSVGGATVVDSGGRKPIHFAAVCSTSDNIKCLIQMGADVLDLDKQQYTPLMYACK
jgi:ankyrin repeat protein